MEQADQLRVESLLTTALGDRLTFELEGEPKQVYFLQQSQSAFSLSFLWGCCTPYIADVPPYMVRPHPLYSFYLMKNTI